MTPQEGRRYWERTPSAALTPARWGLQSPGLRTEGRPGQTRTSCELPRPRSRGEMSSGRRQSWLLEVSVHSCQTPEIEERGVRQLRSTEPGGSSGDGAFLSPAGSLSGGLQNRRTSTGPQQPCGVLAAPSSPPQRKQPNSEQPPPLPKAARPSTLGGTGPQPGGGVLGPAPHTRTPLPRGCPIHRDFRHPPVTSSF